MEDPASWNLLTASLAVCDLKQSLRAWAFLVVQGLVRDSADDRAIFVGFVSEEQARGEITGPSLARRVAGSLMRAGIALPGGQVADPLGKSAADRLEVIASWGPDALGFESVGSLRRLRELGAKAHDGPKKPWWRVL